MAFRLKNLQIEWEAQILRASYMEKNKDSLKIFKKKFSDLWIDTFSGIKEMIMVKFIPTTIVKFENINRRFHLQVIDVKKKKKLYK